MDYLERLDERSSKAARLRRRRERKKKKEKLARKLHAKNTKKDPYSEVGAASEYSDKSLKDKKTLKNKSDLKSALKSLQTVRKTNIKPKHAEAPKALSHLARQKRPKETPPKKTSDDAPAKPEINWGPNAARPSEVGPRDRISQRKKSNIRPSRVGTRVARNLLTMEDILNELQARVDEKRQQNKKEGGHVKSTKSRVTSKPTIRDALKTMKHGAMFSTPKSDRIYVVTNAVWGQKSGSGKVAKGFSHSPAFSKIKGYSDRTKKKYGSKNKGDKKEKSDE